MRRIYTLNALKNYALKNASTMVHEWKKYTVLEPDFWHHGTFDVMWRIYPLNALKTASRQWLNEEKKYTVLEPDFWLSWNSPPSTLIIFM
jgi:hypothetical protein